jgi:hypothetical protein
MRDRGKYLDFCVDLKASFLSEFYSNTLLTPPGPG